MTRPPLPAAAVALLACPVCGASVTGDGEGLRCAAGHRFDRARQGHITLLAPGARAPSGDSAGMVADRVAFLDAGHYAGLSAAIGDAVLGDVVFGDVVFGDVVFGDAVLGDAAIGPARVPGRLLDLGGGTGHHLAAVLERAPDAVGVVLDASRYAARRAARAHPRALAVVADSWARWPVGDGVLDRVLVVFAPRNGAEAARVLDPDGRLVVVTPTADHLHELSAPLELLRVDPDKVARLSAALEPQLEPVAVAGHREELLLDRAAVLALVGMGPHARHLERDRLAAAVARLPEPVRVTVAVALNSYRPRGRDR